MSRSITASWAGDPGHRERDGQSLESFETTMTRNHLFNVTNRRINKRSMRPGTGSSTYLILPQVVDGLGLTCQRVPWVELTLG
jgi:hypothetical protein